MLHGSGRLCGYGLGNPSFHINLHAWSSGKAGHTEEKFERLNGSDEQELI